MQDSILARLEASRKELLDLGLRNPLINYRQPKSKGLHIVQERAADVYELLVKGGKAMSFAGRLAKNDGTTKPDFVELNADQLQQAYTDTKLQTAEA